MRLFILQGEPLQTYLNGEEWMCITVPLKERATFDNESAANNTFPKSNRNHGKSTVLLFPSMFVVSLWAKKNERNIATRSFPFFSWFLYRISSIRYEIKIYLYSIIITKASCLSYKIYNFFILGLGSRSILTISFELNGPNIEEKSYPFISPVSSLVRSLVTTGSSDGGGNEKCW